MKKQTVQIKYKQKPNQIKGNKKYYSSVLIKEKKKEKKKETTKIKLTFQIGDFALLKSHKTQVIQITQIIKEEKQNFVSGRYFIAFNLFKKIYPNAPKIKSKYQNELIEIKESSNLATLQIFKTEKLDKKCKLHFSEKKFLKHKNHYISRFRFLLESNQILLHEILETPQQIAISILETQKTPTANSPRYLLHQGIQTRSQSNKNARIRLFNEVPKKTNSQTNKNSKKRKAKVLFQEKNRKIKSQNEVNSFELAREKLQISSIPETLPCRESEMKQIYSFIKKSVGENLDGRCLYISGMPGTGKTATVHEATTRLQKKSKFPKFLLIQINAAKLQTPQHLYTTLYEKIKNKKIPLTKAPDALANFFGSKNQKEKKQYMILIIDELDLLVTRNQKVVYNLFDWPRIKNSRLSVIGISNTMDLPEKLLPKIQSRLGLVHVSFQPYSREQITQIVSSRLASLNIFSPDAIELGSRKIAAVSGDARRALEVFRRAIEIAQMDQKDQVLMCHVSKAIQEMLVSGYVLAIQNLSLHEKIAISSIVKELNVNGGVFVETSILFQRYLGFCRLYQIESVLIPSFAIILNNLSNSRLILIEGKTFLFQKISLNVDPEDVQNALQEEEPFKNFF
ncbi:origin recognition complex subunit 1 [Anaeramoeba ignava]|uniref:Origin recognition complex subunit 1 n=1 Tax=Anaeramoeba ignava TaxID=1746090 RepID=A0A9Q0LHP3_ANAIG|nr:origin recognition complex subunit 1 [Anaeramoeba ignava]